MRWLALVAILGSGCLEQLVPSHKKAEAQAPQPDLAEAEPATDDAALSDDAAPATTGDAGLAGFGQPCATGADCQSGICQTIMQVLICTQSCTLLGQPDPACPNNGACNQNGYCKP